MGGGREGLRWGQKVTEGGLEVPGPSCGGSRSDSPNLRRHLLDCGPPVSSDAPDWTGRIFPVIHPSIPKNKPTAGFFFPGVATGTSANPSSENIRSDTLAAGELYRHQRLNTSK